MCTDHGVVVKVVDVVVEVVLCSDGICMDWGCVVGG